MIIESQKNYNHQEAEQIFFRPTFCGKSIEDLGVRVVYNLPMPTLAYMFSHPDSILKTFSAGWQGGPGSIKEQVKINMNKVKAEMAYSAEEYFNTVLELVTNSADVNLGDLTGTELEKAETELFRRALAESIYATMWLGDEAGVIAGLTTFNGFIQCICDIFDDYGTNSAVRIEELDSCMPPVEYFSTTWRNAKPALRALASEGQLAYYVTSDLYDAYQYALDNQEGGMGYYDMQNGRPQLYYHGIPIIEVPVAKYDPQRCKTFCILTDRRNLVLAINTKDAPENEVRMWYNPDEMENRQRAVFLAGTAVVDQDLVSAIMYHAGGDFS